MSQRSKPVLRQIENNIAINENTANEFLFHMQSALLLALREREILNILQHRYAQAKLSEQYREWNGGRYILG